MKSYTENETSFEALFLNHYESVFCVLYRMLGDRAEAEDYEYAGDNTPEEQAQWIIEAY